MREKGRPSRTDGPDYLRKRAPVKDAGGSLGWVLPLSICVTRAPSLSLRLSGRD
jgi:hypothetical protein